MWSGQIDQYLRDLDETGDVPAVAAAMKRTVDGIAAELRTRAA